MARKSIEITKAVAQKVLAVVDKGLSSGMGDDTPGEMCVEAAVCYAMGEPHSDEPRCVTRAIRDTKIDINDHDIWNERDWSERRVNKRRARGLRRLAIAQLGSKGVISDKQWDAAMKALIRDKWMPKDEEKAVTLEHLDRLRAEVVAGNRVDTYVEHYPPTPPDACLDAILGVHGHSLAVTKRWCEDLVQLLVKLKSPGAKYLYLTE